MSTATVAALFNLAQLPGSNVVDGLRSAVAASQAAAPNLPAKVNRVQQASANGSFILDSLIDGDSQGSVWVLNESTQTINVFPFVGEKMDGVANQVKAIPTGCVGIFIPVVNGLGALGLTPGDWRSAVTIA